ncbi:hypothetical protein [Nitrosomonas sp.]|uniref:hypothetical protein n=1 Tax=Nitrosomonas sp. TaxID=42353 RepID=UPI0025FD74F5|nr:hypothetical protein [Nitrosomonas sp.]MBV6447377.1 hypothetical protein [Nitrosomonas sp.]
MANNSLNKIKPSKVPKNHNKGVHPAKPHADNETIRFSFKHLDLNNKKFSCGGKKSDYFTKVLERLKNISHLKISEIFSNRSPSLRAHPIDWDETTETNGFISLNEQLRQVPAYQFQISSNEHGRLHGFILSNIFFVVWLDPEHNLYE